MLIKTKTWTPHFVPSGQVLRKTLIYISNVERQGWLPLHVAIARRTKAYRIFLLRSKIRHAPRSQKATSVDRP
jgi:hypothetical protein